VHPLSAAQTSAARPALERAARHAPFLAGLIRREPELVARLEAGGWNEAFADAIARLDPARPRESLRHARAGVALAVAIADLAGAWTFETVTTRLSDFADRAVNLALAAAFADLGLEPGGVTVLALGKHGSRELNYSSDVDLIVLHDPDVIDGRQDPDETAVRIVRRMATLLSERTADGYALRVDLRLRPDPDSTPPSLRIGAAESYYQSQALAWERSAFIRARAVAGDLAMGRGFLRALEPFVWRRSLDYSALADIREVSHQIRDHYAEVQEFGPGWDAKRGRGGIREVEFSAQIPQLIFGGREPSLRAAATLDALEALARAGRLPRAEADMLKAAYRQLRTLEHRLQMVADQQTHVVPRLATERAKLAGLMGEAAWSAVARLLEPTTRAVARHYDRLLADGGGATRSPRVPQEREDVLAYARAHRIADPELLASSLATWRAGRPRSLRMIEARHAFEAVLPALLKATGAGREGRAGLVRLDRFVRALPSGVQFWRLLMAQPKLIGLLGRLLTEAPLLADSLAQRPDLFDVVIDPPGPLASVADAAAELRAGIRGEGIEPILDRARRWTAERRFRVAIDLLEGRRDALDAAAELSDLAEAALQVVADAVIHEFSERHGSVPGAELVVLGLGRLGGRALTFQSDLDLVLLFTGRPDARATGGLSATAWFNRAGQRLVSALSVPTASGPLYAIDTRLRPSGAQGLLVVSVSSFLAYQREEAELWERLALTRARVLFGSDAARAEVSNGLQSLFQEPMPADLVTDAVREMRALMDTHKPAAGPMDVKLVKGGLVDLEFILEARALMAGVAMPPALDAAARRFAPALEAPYRFLMTVLLLLRLIVPAGTAAAPDRAQMALLARACGKSSVAEVRRELGLAREAVLRAWEESFGRRR
jgi:glutamate-ammonia-ligase adenylyltransferase